MNITLQSIMDAWYIIAIFYFVFFWGLPMVGMAANPWAQESKVNYWKGVRVVAATFHVSGIVAFTLFWYLSSYLFPAQ